MGIDPGRVELIEGADSNVGIPLEDASIDFVQSQGSSITPATRRRSCPSSTGCCGPAGAA